MAGETRITIVGGITADVDLRYTQGGKAVANFTIASSPKVFDKQANQWKDGDTLFMRCTVWRDYAEHVAGSLTKGMRVIAQGVLRQRSFTDKEGNNRTVIELDIDEIGPSLRFATAQVHRVDRQQGGAPQAQQGAPPQTAFLPQAPAEPQPPLDDGWAAPGTYGDETPW